MPRQLRGSGWTLPGLSEAPAHPEGVPARRRYRGAPQGVLHRTADGCYFFPSVGLLDGTAREGEQVERAEGIEHPQTPLPPRVRRVEAIAAIRESVP